MFEIIGGVVVGVILLAWLYHRYTAQTTTALDSAANTVNTIINDVKADVKTSVPASGNVVVSNTTVANT